MRIEISGSNRNYPVDISTDTPEKMAGELFNLRRKVLIITDDNIPGDYYKPIEDLCKKAYVIILPHGEKYKGIEAYSYIMDFLIKHSFYRDDCIVSVGGGVVSDLAGFAAATYERGIDYYSVPTTLLSQVDASIGGKTGINFDGYKNMIGAFYPPRAVAVSPWTLETLDDRQFSNGMAEVIKMAVCLNKGFFERLEKIRDLRELRRDEITLKKIVAESILTKQSIIEKDEKEKSARRMLNFGHTIGHGIESLYARDERKGKLLHGECVAIGMVPMCSNAVRERLKSVLATFNLPVTFPRAISPESLLDSISHDKKIDGDGFNIVIAQEIGRGKIIRISEEELRAIIEGEIL